MGVPATDVPARIGPYEIDRVVGEGGMGVVYRARRAGAGPWCAVKTVRSLDARHLGTLRREIRALSRLRHPGIVNVLDEGIHDGTPWYAMELLEGSTLASRYHSSWSGSASPRAAGEGPTAPTMSGFEPPTGPVDTQGEAATAAVERDAVTPGAPPAGPVAGGGHLEELLASLKRLCAPLAFLHGEGLVHCDLKPANVFFRADGSPVVGDFGLASHVAGAHGRDVLEVLGGVRGSAHYMAPEQVLGQPVDARTDLYALGCMLYEAVTGRPPFLGTTEQVFVGHLSGEPLAPSRLVTGTPPGLEAVIGRLLAKQPGQRIGYADDVARMLAPFCADRPAAADLPPPRPYLCRSELVGRDEELARLKRRLEAAAGGSGGCVFVGGESGVGKTRLAAELGLQAASMNVQVVTGQCAEPVVGASGGAPLEALRPFLRALADRCRELGPQESARLLGARGPVLASYEPALTDVPGAGAWPDAARLGAEAARRRLFDALLEALKTLAEDKALLLILDDLQWSDELTRAFLAFLPGRLAETRVLVLGTYRIEELSGELRAIVTSSDVEHMPLGRLGEQGVGSMAGDMLAMEEPPPGFVSFLARETEGNPFFVAEYLRAAVAQKVLHRDDQGLWRLARLYAVSEGAFESLPLPRSLRALVGLRLGGLPEDVEQVVRTAAVLGREFDPELLDRAVDLSPERTMDAVQELVARQVLEHSVAGTLRFPHHKVREVAYDDVPDPARAELHRRAASAIESLGGEALQLAQHADLGRHWSLGARPESAAHHYRLAAEKAAEIYANAQAIDCYRLALVELERAGHADAGDESSETVAGAIHEGLGNVLSLTARQGEAREAYAAALDRCGPRRLRAAKLHRRIGKTWEIHHEHENALASYGQAERELGADPFEPVDGWWESWIETRLDRAWVNYWRGEADLMAVAIDAVRPHVLDQATPRLRARFFELLAILGSRQERYLLSDETVGYSLKAWQASEEAGDPVQVAESLFELGFAQLFHGDVEPATETLTKALAEGRRIGDITRQARCLTYLTLCHRRAKRTSLVETLGRQSLEAAQESGIPVYVGTSQANLAWVDLQAGRYAEAQERCQSALAIWQGIDAAFPFFWMAALPLLAIRLGRGDLTESIRLAEAMLAPAQQRLPARLATPLVEAVEAARGQNKEQARAALARTLEAAEDTGYL